MSRIALSRSQLAAIAVFAGMAALFALGARPAGALVVFTTHEIDDGDLGGWADADAATVGLAAANSICKNLANDAGFLNPSSFRAWISTEETDAFCNVAGLSGKKSDSCGAGAGQPLPEGGPWVRVDGKPFAKSLKDLTERFAVLYESILDQHNHSAGAEGSVHTGSTAAGVWSGNSCLDWESKASNQFGQYGGWSAGAQDWANQSSGACNVDRHLYCFESGAGTPLTSFGEPGAWAFVTSFESVGDLDQWPDANGQQGILAGIEICKQAARDGNLPSPDSYVPWLSDSNTNAIDLLTIDGPWRRSDGVVVATSKTNFGGVPHSAMTVDEFGNYVADFVFTGSSPAGAPLGGSCGDWKSASGLSNGGRSSESVVSWTTSYATDCAFPNRIYCLGNVLVVFADGFERDETFEWTDTVP